MAHFITHDRRIEWLGIVQVGTPHTWPTLLAAIMWLVELLSYDEQVQYSQQVDGGQTIEGNDGLILIYGYSFPP